MRHIPVLVDEVLEVLAPRPKAVLLDATLGDGGHAQAWLEATQPLGRVWGVEQDYQQLVVAKANLASFGGRVDVSHGRFGDLAKLADSLGLKKFDAALFDLGVSSRQLADLKYGLTFDDAAPLDMRLAGQTTTAADFLNQTGEKTLADALYRFGDRHDSRRLAQKIVVARRNQPFRVAGDLKRALKICRPNELAPIFQALRIWVNDEAGQLAGALPQAVELLRPGGRLAVISFHSGEDRAVKHFLAAAPEIESPKGVIRPTLDEIRANPRARSAKLRWGEKVSRSTARSGEFN